MIVGLADDQRFKSPASKTLQIKVNATHPFGGRRAAMHRACEPRALSATLHAPEWMHNIVLYPLRCVCIAIATPSLPLFRCAFAFCWSSWTEHNGWPTS